VQLTRYSDYSLRVLMYLALRSVLHEALVAFLLVLDGHTLADLVARRRGPLARLLEAS
jgi:DNA-binding IscR family transcriptional regulator